jgi:hypothetical protein
MTNNETKQSKDGWICNVCGDGRTSNGIYPEAQKLGILGGCRVFTGGKGIPTQCIALGLKPIYVKI